MGDGNFPGICWLASQLLTSFPAESPALFVFMSIGATRFRRAGVLYGLSFGNGRREDVRIVLHEIDEQYC